MPSKKPLSDLTRREFVQIAASVTAIASSGKAWSTTATPDRMFEYGDPLKEFQYRGVQFQPGLHQAQLEQTHAILMGMDEDSLLRPYRLRGGFPAPGFELGGWYSSNDRDPGHAFGQWLSALSRYYALTGDEATRGKVFRLVQGFADTIEPTGKFYDKYEEGSYTYMMLVGGLMDSHEFVRVPGALHILSRATDAAMPHFPKEVVDTKTAVDWGFMMPDSQFTAWQRGGRADHLEIAKQYLHHVFFDALARGENVLAERHAYGHVTALCSAAKAYLVLGDESYLKAAVNGFRFVEQQSFATGGWGPSETFLPRPTEEYTDPNTGQTTHYPAIETLADSIISESNHFETGCGSYAHFKLTRYLLRITKNSHYGDSMERVMYNTVLGALPLNKYGKAFYQSNYHSHAHKAYFDGYGHVMSDEWPCCSGTLPQVAADYHISTYFQDQEGIFINLFIPSTLKWEQHGAELSLAQSGQYPVDDHVAFEVTTSRPERFVIRLRIPAWAEGASIRINGRKIPETVQSGTFATMSRQWKSGDRIELELPRRLELKPVDAEHPNTVALVCGPIVLFAISDDTPKVTRSQLLAARQQAPGSAEWLADTGAGHLRLAPFWVVKDETYFTYFSV